ncbi:ATPase, AAA-type, core, P-loop containing nucleoside triphosphate hydrolase [Artemisia annua]|uniref:ATPase, AAA-type, core, P-loop containing nucleoside triphosphate hydrolase n=1 Tax=Artemisia annua TaxID=35608 RepID=A0A2U1NFH8_ARTAN|nr:ATPase, AAA-type, core, P-loop containing nucleoside triphosphate hydrolase [Artemisia annua]
MSTTVPNIGWRSWGKSRETEEGLQLKKLRVLGNQEKKRMDQNPTSTSFRCCCSKEETFVETITGSDTGAWKQFVPNLFIWMLFFGPIKGALSAISKLIRMGVVVFLTLRVLNTKLRFGSKKAEPRNITFDELAGVDEPTIKSVLQRTSEFKKLKVALPHGILLYGAPGTGKTTLVHALAREARVSFFPISALDIAKGNVRLKCLFNEARAHSPSIVYIRDIDFIAQQEKDCESGSPLIQLHTEMEKCNKNECMVMVIVATNINENIDAAMMSCNLYFDKVHVRKPDEDGLVWHDLEHLANLSRRFAAHRGDDHVTVDDVVQALERIKNVFSNLDKQDNDDSSDVEDNDERLHKLRAGPSRGFSKALYHNYK